MTTYYIFFSIIGILTLVMTFLVSKNYAPLLVSYITNEKLWNPNSDRIKLTFTISFFIAPFIFLKQLIKYNSENFIFNCVCLSLIVLTMAFCIWMINKVFSMDFDSKSNSNKTISAFFKSKADYNKVMELLKDNKILNENLHWEHNNNSHKKKYISVLICKLISLDIIKFKKLKRVHKLFEKQLNIKFDYNLATQVIKFYSKEGLFIDKDSNKYFEKLSFLDSINSK